MTSYNLSIHRACSSYAGLDSFSSHFFKLKDEDEFNKVQEMCENEKNMAGILKWSFMPIRTDGDFLLQDLILPTLMNGVMKAKNAASAGLVFIAILWDLATLPARILALPLRAWYNAGQTPDEHPLVTFLKGKGLVFSKIDGKENMAGELSIRVYKEEVEKTGPHAGGNIQNGNRYMLHLTDHEVPFWSSSCAFGSSSAPQK